MQIFPTQDNIRRAMGRTILQALHLRLRINRDVMVVKNAEAARDIAIFSNTLDTSWNLFLITCETRREQKVSSMAKESKKKGTGSLECWGFSYWRAIWIAASKQNSMIMLSHSRVNCLRMNILICCGLMAGDGICCVGGGYCSSTSIVEWGWGASDCAVRNNISVSTAVKCKGCVSWVRDNSWL